MPFSGQPHQQLLGKQNFQITEEFWGIFKYLPPTATSHQNFSTIPVLCSADSLELTYMFAFFHRPACFYSKIYKSISKIQASLMAQTVKNLPAMQETWVQSLGWKDPLEEGKATHSSILPWRNPMDCILPGSSASVQTRILEWVALPSSRGSFQPWD